jgi:hypothetical protein
MTERRLLALIALLIGLIGGLLILSNGVNPARLTSSLEDFLNLLVFLVLGLAILLGSVLIYRGKYGAGGIVNILLGVVAWILKADVTGAILAIVAGVIGLIATEPRSSD